MSQKEKLVTIKLSHANARLLARNIDGWMDAGSGSVAETEGLTAAELKALKSAFDQIMRQVTS